MDTQDSPRKLLILDIDGTLIDAHFASDLDQDSRLHDEEITEKKPFIRIWKRPGLDSFLDWVHEKFEIAVWSASDDEYVNLVISKIFKERNLLFAWSSQRCTFKSINPVSTDDPRKDVIKDIKKVKEFTKGKYSKNNIIVIDDTPSTYMRNRGNAIPISTFHRSHSSDNDFEAIKKRLELLLNCEDIRKHNKRY